MSGGCDSVPRTEFHGWQVHFGKPKPGSDAILSSPMHIYESYCQWQCLLMIEKCKVEAAVHHVHLQSISIISFHHSSSSFTIFTASFDEFVCIVCGLSWDFHGTGNQRRNAWKVWNFWKCLPSLPSLSSFETMKHVCSNIQRPDANQYQSTCHQCILELLAIHSYPLSYAWETTLFLALGCWLEVYCFIACQRQNHGNHGNHGNGHPSTSSEPLNHSDSSGGKMCGKET